MNAPVSSSENRRASTRHAWLLVAGREITTKALTKSFIIGTVLTLLLIAGSIAIPTYLSSGGGVTTAVVVVNDEGKELAEKVGRAVSSAEAKDRVEVVQAADQGAAEALLREGKADVLLTRSGHGWQAAAKENPPENLVRHIRQVLSAQVLAEVADQAGTSVQEVEGRSAVSTRVLSDQAEAIRGASIAVKIIFAILFYMSVIVFGVQIAQSVLEEKQSRIVEILAAVVPVRQLLIGKVVGNTVIAVGQLVLYLGVGVVGATFTPLSSLLPAMSNGLIWYVVFFLAGFLALGCLWAAAGAMSTRTEDLQQTMTPLTMFLAAAFFGALFVTGTWAKVASYIPIASSMVMPTRLLQGDAAWWEAVISLAVTVLFAGFATVIGERMYRNSLMQTSSQTSFKEALRSAD
ncbi:ABC transporter permease [Austwickia chelonae]|uniref:ABC transporter permease n=1 Tax=Austwickia chelonae TaxID=100225 RepID=UPI000E2342CC|nr:ABC transporter permease [Austwickia chelonae]